MKRANLLLLAHAAALWPVGVWYVSRTASADGDWWGVAALAAACVSGALARTAPPDREPRLALPIALLVVHVVTRPFLPPLFAAALGAASLAALVSETRFGRRLEPALLGLAWLALPSVSTLQFFVGWPLRVGVGAVVAPALAALGIDARCQGTSLVVAGRAVAVDAPCSGVWLLWGALLVWLALALARRLSVRATAVGTLVTLAVVFVANALRTLCLVLVATRPGLPHWTHEAVGVVVLAAAAAAVVVYSERTSRCAPRCST